MNAKQVVLHGSTWEQQQRAGRRAMIASAGIGAAVGALFWAGWLIAQLL